MSTMTTDGLSKRVALRRKAVAISQAELGERVGLGQSEISRIESGDRKIDSLELHKIARALDTTPSDLLEPDPLRERLEKGLIATRAISAALTRSRVSEDNLHTWLHRVVRAAMQPEANGYAVVAEVAEELEDMRSPLTLRNEKGRK